jgi:hypothetical protein
LRIDKRSGSQNADEKRCDDNSHPTMYLTRFPDQSLSPISRAKRTYAIQLLPIVQGARRRAFQKGISPVRARYSLPGRVALGDQSRAELAELFSVGRSTLYRAIERAGGRLDRLIALLCPW